MYEKIKERLEKTIKERKESKKHIKYHEVSYRVSPWSEVEANFTPLPSDLIQDPHVWTEWELDDNYNVTKKEQNNA